MGVSAPVLLIAILIGVGALAKPVARRLRTPLAIVHAALGIGIGALCLVALDRPDLPLLPDLARVVTGLPLDAPFFLYGLLPVLLFQSALAVDAHRIREDLLPILLLAIVAVVLVTLGIGLALWPFASVSLAACLLLASIVATTDPVAVIAIFRAVGAPDHLVRLVEGESLFNDAAAVALFLAFAGLVVAPGQVSLASALTEFVVMPAGGALLGGGMAWATVAAMRWLPGDRVGAASLSLALPYLAFVGGGALGVSDVIAVVAAGVTMATLAPGRIAGEAWRYLQDVWELLADSAGVLVFVLTSILVPRLLTGATWHDLWLLVVVFVAALATRAAVLLGVFPALARLGRSLDVPRGYRLVALWGGLRGSMTLVLALAVTENPAIPREVAEFVAILATGFTLATLFIHGTTLQPLIRRLRLDELSEVDRAVRDLALAESGRHVAQVLGAGGSRPGPDAPTENAHSAAQAPDDGASAPGSIALAHSESRRHAAHLPGEAGTAPGSAALTRIGSSPHSALMGVAPPELASAALARAERADAREDGPPPGAATLAGGLAPGTAAAIALVAVTAREREVVLDHFDRGTLAPRAARILVARTRHRLDLSRVAGAGGYATATAEETGFGPWDRIAAWLQQRAGWSRPLADSLGIRCQVLLGTALVVRGLPAFVDSELRPVLGDEAAATVAALLAERRAGLDRAIAALRLQYPAYAAAVERGMAGRAAAALEAADAARMRRVGIVSAEVERAILADAGARAAAHAGTPRLDLGLDARALVEACALFAPLSPAERDGLARHLHPFLATPGTRLIRRGERGTEAFFLSSGAVEVDTGRAVRRLGSGDAFGEMALILDLPRQADVTAIAFSRLLRLTKADFHAFLARHPALRERLADLAQRRLSENLEQRSGEGSETG